MPDYPPLPGGGHNHFDVHGGERDAVTSALAGFSQSGHTHGGTSPFPVHVVTHSPYSAAGDSHHNNAGGTDDTAAIQAAIDDAAAIGGYGLVVIPGRRTYRITDTINVPSPMQIVGTGYRNNAGIGLPGIVWDGADGGVPFDVASSGQNIAAVAFRNLQILGKGSGDAALGPMPSAGIRFRPTGENLARLDSGTYIDEVWFAKINGNAIHIDSLGTTNFWVRGGRWDQINGYGLYTRIDFGGFISVRDVTWDNWPSGSANPRGEGFIHLDADNAEPDGSICMLEMSSIHTEANHHLIETSPGGDLPADRRGVVRLSINTTSNRQQMWCSFQNLHHLGWTANEASHSYFQITGGTSAQRKERAVIVGNGFRGLGGTSGNANGHVQFVGNVPSGDKLPNGKSGWARVLWSPGGLSSNEHAQDYTNDGS